MIRNTSTTRQTLLSQRPKIRYRRAAAWTVVNAIAFSAALISYKVYEMSRESSDPMSQMCGSVVDARSSLLEVGAEALARDSVGRSDARDQLDTDVRKLTEYANRTSDPALRTAATNARQAIARALHLTPHSVGDDIWGLKMCLLGRFFDESEVISAKCRSANLPATPPPSMGDHWADPYAPICSAMFSSAM